MVDKIKFTTKPALTVKPKQARLDCPNCDNVLEVELNSVDIGNIVKCGKCGKSTYYPFNKPWYRMWRAILLWLSTLFAGIIIGYFGNRLLDHIMQPPETQEQSTTFHQNDGENHGN